VESGEGHRNSKIVFSGGGSIQTKGMQPTSWAVRGNEELPAAVCHEDSMVQVTTIGYHIDEKDDLDFWALVRWAPLERPFTITPGSTIMSTTQPELVQVQALLMSCRSTIGTMYDG